MAEPRPQHYIFAHIALPALFLRTPESMLQNFEQVGPEFLRYLWRQIGLKEGSHDEQAGMRIAVDVYKIEDDTIGLIRLPAPEFMTEAYAVAAFLSGEQKRYFTLEHGHNLDGTRRTVLCEWDNAGRHINHGDGPDPEDAEAFIATVRRIAHESIG